MDDDDVEGGEAPVEDSAEADCGGSDVSNAILLKAVQEGEENRHARNSNQFVAFMRQHPKVDGKLIGQAHATMCSATQVLLAGTTTMPQLQKLVGRMHTAAAAFRAESAEPGDADEHATEAVEPVDDTDEVAAGPKPLPVPNFSVTEPPADQRTLFHAALEELEQL